MWRGRRSGERGSGTFICLCIRAAEPEPERDGINTNVRFCNRGRYWGGLSQGARLRGLGLDVFCLGLVGACALHARANQSQHTAESNR